MSRAANPKTARVRQANPAAAATPAPAPAPSPLPRPGGKLGVLVDLLSQADGVSIHDLAEATGWQVHSVRGALAGALRKRGYAVTSQKTGKVRLYRIGPTTPDAPSAPAVD